MNGIVSNSGGKFRPSDLVTRAEMVKMLLVAQGYKPTHVSSGFSDVPETMGDLYTYFNAAVDKGFVNPGRVY